MITSPGFNVPGTTTQSGRVNGKADASFSRRQGNSVQYWTPVFQGLSARFAYSRRLGRRDADQQVVDGSGARGRRMVRAADAYEALRDLGAAHV